jgi:hypothetical protein
MQAYQGGCSSVVSTVKLGVCDGFDTISYKKEKYVQILLGKPLGNRSSGGLGRT